jgi:hypothetical protein
MYPIPAESEAFPCLTDGDASPTWYSVRFGLRATQDTKMGKSSYLPYPLLVMPKERFVNIKKGETKKNCVK